MTKLKTVQDIEIENEFEVFLWYDHSLHKDIE